MTEEIFKPIPGFDAYEVSNLGRVKSLKFPQKPRILKAQPNTFGYPTVQLRRDGKTVAIHIHTCVLLAFVGPRPEGNYCSLHDDDNPANNALSNLCWGTRSENSLQVVRKGRRTQPNPTPLLGCDHPQSNLTPEQVRAIRNSPKTCKALALEFGSSAMAVSRIKRNLTYKNV